MRAGQNPPVPLSRPSIARPSQAIAASAWLGETDPQNVHMEKAEPTRSLVTATRLAFTAALGGFLFGYDSAVINGAVKAIGDHYHVSASGLGFTVSSALLGAAVGAILAGRVADRFGRLRAMLLAAVLFLISALGAGLVDTLGSLIVFRVIGGIGVGMASVIAPAYIAEIAPASIRGRLGSVQQLAIVLGIFVALLADYVLAKVAGGSEHDLALGLEAWRWMFLAMIGAGRALRRAGDDDPGVAAIPGLADAPGRSEGRVAAGPRHYRRRRQGGGDPADPQQRAASEAGGPARLGTGVDADRVGRDRAVRLPAVRRDQCHLLLLERSLAGGGLQREQLIGDHT